MTARHPLITAALWIVFTPLLLTLILLGLTFVMLSCGRVSDVIR